MSLSASPARVATDMARATFLGMCVSVDYIWTGFLGRFPPATPTHLATGADELSWKAGAFSEAGLERSRLPSVANPRPALPPPRAGHRALGGRGPGRGGGGRGPPGRGRGFVAGAEAGCSPVGSARCSRLQENLSLPAWLGRGLGFAFCFWKSPFTLVSPRVQPRGSCGKAAVPRGAPRPAHAGTPKGTAPGGSQHPGGGAVSALALPAQLPAPAGVGSAAGGCSGLGRGVRGGCLPGWVGGDQSGEVEARARPRLFRTQLEACLGCRHPGVWRR